MIVSVPLKSVIGVYTIVWSLCVATVPLVADVDNTVRGSPSASVSLPITLIVTDIFSVVATTSTFAMGGVLYILESKGWLKNSFVGLLLNPGVPLYVRCISFAPLNI